MNSKRKITRSFRQPFTNLIQDKNTIVWNLTPEKRISDKHSDMNILGDYCYISKGMVLNADEKTAQGEFAKKDLISNKRDKIHCRKYIEAKDIEKYGVKKIRYLEYNTERCPDKLSRPTFRELYNCKKLMFNRLGSLMVYLDDKTKFLHSDSMFSGVLWKDLKGVRNKSIAASISRYSRLSRNEMESLSKQIDLRYLLGILNSKYAAVLLTNLRGGDYHIYPEHLRNLPIPAATPKKQQAIISFIDKIISAKTKNHNADTTKLESKIDRLVYKLYSLTENEIKIIEG
jgi:adenine-specific DNA-methyltransferase